MKLVISKNKEGNGYYTKVQNDYNGKHTEKYLTLQIPKGTDLEYGIYDVDGFLSTYEKKDGSVEFKLVVLDITPIKEFKEPQKTAKTFEESIGTKEWKQATIDDESLPF